VTLNGATLRPDWDDNHALYGHDVTVHDILEGKAKPTPAAQPLYDDLQAFPRKG
jgi:lipid-binding SYLF domain-containing protein